LDTIAFQERFNEIHMDDVAVINDSEVIWSEGQFVLILFIEAITDHVVSFGHS
jgi:hypothetical protein